MITETVNKTNAVWDRFVTFFINQRASKPALVTIGTIAIFAGVSGYTIGGIPAAALVAVGMLAEVFVVYVFATGTQRARRDIEAHRDEIDSMLSDVQDLASDIDETKDDVFDIKTEIESVQNDVGTSRDQAETASEQAQEALQEAQSLEKRIRDALR